MTLTPPPGPRSAATLRRLSAIALMMSLAACGGGGSSDSSSPAPPPPPPPPPPSSGPYAITGKAVYESVPPKTDQTGLNYAAATDKPIRGATVQLLGAGSAVLATTTTDTAGNYSFSLPTSQAVTIRVRAEIKRTGSPSGDRDFTVLDNTRGNALYAAGLGSSSRRRPRRSRRTCVRRRAGAARATPRRALPARFALLDVVYDAQAKIATVAPTVTLPPLKVFWSVNNRPVSPFNATTGAIVTSFFTTGSSGRALYILGAADTDTDEYDTHVIAHEFGHYLQNVVSRDDTIGGFHTSGDKLDARVAFSEGWGYAWAGIALGDPLTTDTFGAGQARSFNIDVSVAPTGIDRGWYSESAAEYLIWKTNQTTGFGPVYSALTTFPSSPAFSTLYSFAAAVKAAASPANAAAITALYTSQQIFGTDAFGANETNNGAVPGGTILPVYKPHTAGLGVAQNYCVTAAADPTNDGNKLGEFVYVRFSVMTGSHTLTVVKTSPAGTAVTDPDFTLLKADGTTIDAQSPSDGTGGSVNDTESLTLTLPTGTHTIALSDSKLKSPNTSCFNFTVN